MDKLKYTLIVLFSSVFITTGCVNIDNNVENEDKATDTTINNQIDNNKETADKEVDKSNNENKDDIVNNNSTNKDNDKDEEVSNVEESSFDIYSLDVNSEEKIILGSLKIEEKKSVDEKLNLLINEISKLQFNNAPIKLIKIENNIAYIDLQEGESKNYWSSGYFQGSTGANITSYTLTESLLQRDYKGKWIDGICFSYEGKTDIEFDHMGIDFFGNVIKR